MIGVKETGCNRQDDFDEEMPNRINPIPGTDHRGPGSAEGRRFFDLTTNLSDRVTNGKMIQKENMAIKFSGTKCANKIPRIKMPRRRDRANQEKEAVRI